MTLPTRTPSLRIAAVLLLAIGAAGQVGAAESSFVPAKRTQGLLLLAAPPPAVPGAVSGELAELHQIEAARTKEQVARAQADEKEESIFLFRSVMGGAFSAQALPLTALLSDHVGLDVGANTGPLKRAYARMRPYNADPSLHPACKTNSKDDSYPSSHATAGYLQALTLIELMPEKRDAILQRAQEYANNRLVCGVHYPSDIEAGKVLAYAVHATMRDHPQYQLELAAARRELRSALDADSGKK